MVTSFADRAVRLSRRMAAVLLRMVLISGKIVLMVVIWGIGLFCARGYYGFWIIDLEGSGEEFVF